MIPTPELSHLTRNDYLEVYEPAEDTFCLLDALEQDAEQLKAAAPRLVVEIGSGSGCVSAFVSSLLGPTQAAYLCTDINGAALAATIKTGLANRTHLSPIRTSLLSALQSRCRGKVDLLLFNPPYVPTSDVEERAAQERGLLEGSWAGGVYGTSLLDDLIPILREILAASGSLYLVAVQPNNPPGLVQRLEREGLSATICLSRRAGREHLFIIRATKS